MRSAYIVVSDVDFLHHFDCYRMVTGIPRLSEIVGDRIGER